MTNPAIETVSGADTPGTVKPIFTFESSFEILYAVCGGHIVTQNRIGQPSFSKAFSDLEDLVHFFIQQKEQFDYDNA